MPIKGRVTIKTSSTKKIVEDIIRRRRTALKVASRLIERQMFQRFVRGGAPGELWEEAKKGSIRARRRGGGGGFRLLDDFGTMKNSRGSVVIDDKTVEFGYTDEKAPWHHEGVNKEVNVREHTRRIGYKKVSKEENKKGRKRVRLEEAIRKRGRAIRRGHEIKNVKIKSHKRDQFLPERKLLPESQTETNEVEEVVGEILTGGS